MTAASILARSGCNNQLIAPPLAETPVHCSEPQKTLASAGNVSEVISTIGFDSRCLRFASQKCSQLVHSRHTL